MGFEMPKFTIVNDLQIKDDLLDARVQILAAQEEISAKESQDKQSRNQRLLEAKMKAEETSGNKALSEEEQEQIR